MSVYDLVNRRTGTSSSQRGFRRNNCVPSKLLNEYNCNEILLQIYGLMISRENNGVPFS